MWTILFETPLFRYLWCTFNVKLNKRAILLYSSYLLFIYTLERTVGSCKCYCKRCEVCKNVTETSTFISTTTQNTYKINHQFNCSEKWLVYLITCNKCYKQYVRQTVDEFCRTWNNYKSNDRKFQRLEPCMQEHLAGHDGFLNDVSITFIDKTHPSVSLRREDYWRQTLKEMLPYGFDIEDSVWWVSLCLLFYMVTSVIYTVMSACFWIFISK